MDVKRTFNRGGPMWVLSGDIDDDSALRLESMLLNSQWKGGAVTIDLSGIGHISIEGRKVFNRIYEGLRSRGGDVEVIDTRHTMDV